MKYFGLSLLSCSVLLANPSAPVVMEGTSSFAQSGQLLEVTAADKAVIHWDNFSIANGETTRFIQPSQQAVVLNRVIGPLQSFIDGNLEANGRVVLVNPNGVIVGPNGVILAADFIASTYDIFDIKTGSILASSPQSDFSGAINMDGVIRATGFAEQGGRIMLVASQVHVEGELIAPHGTIDVLGAVVSLDKAAHLDVSSDLGGGLIRVGGDFQGKNAEIPNAQAVFVGPEVRIEANGQQTSDGGRVIIWSDQFTSYQGMIAAKGGDFGGNGGFVEISSKGQLGFQGPVNTSAPQGIAGSLLLDPCVVTIDGVGGTTVGVTPPPPYPPCPGCPAGLSYAFPLLAAATINSADLSSALDNCCDVTIDASASGTALTGSITVNAASPVNWTTGNRLTLIADGNITILSDVSCSAAGPISITAGGALTVGSVANVATAIVQTQGQIDVLAGTGMSVIGGMVGGSAAIQTNALTAPLNVTVTSGNMVVSALTSIAKASVGTPISGGPLNIQVLNGTFRIENNNTGEAFIDTSDFLTINASQNIEVMSFGDSTADIRCTSSTGTPSVITSGVDTIFSTALLVGNYDSSFQNSAVTWNVGRDMRFLSSSANDVSITFGAGATCNIGRDFYASSMGSGVVSISSNANFTMNVANNFTIQNQAGFRTVVFANGPLDLNVVGDVLVENLGVTTVLNAVLGGAAGLFVDAGGDITLGRDSIAASFGGPIVLIANQNISMGLNSFIGGAFGFNPISITLVVDNQAPAAPAIGTGSFTMDPTAVINTGPAIPVQIFTARQSQNSIQGLINGSPFTPGPFNVDTPTEHWGVYYPDAFVGPLYTVFYKEGFPSTPAILTAILTASTQSIAGTFDTFEEFAAPLPYYDDHFCFTYQGEEQSSMSRRKNPPFQRKQCLWILVDNYRKYYPSLSRWEYVQPTIPE